MADRVSSFTIANCYFTVGDRVTYLAVDDR